jgi:Mn-containing catalase
MFLRIDKLQIELPRPAQADPESAGIVQELMGGKFGEMSTPKTPTNTKIPELRFRALISEGGAERLELARV